MANLEENEPKREQMQKTSDVRYEISEKQKRYISCTVIDACSFTSELKVLIGKNLRQDILIILLKFPVYL